MIRTSILSSTILVLSLIWYGTAGLSTAVAQEPIPHAPLRVSIEFSERMQPLDPLLWTGNCFDEKVATALLKDKATNTSIWKKIPAWQAGEWENNQATNTKVDKYINGQPRPDTTNGVYTAKGRSTHGLQKDKNGDVWQRYHSGYWTGGELYDYVCHSFIQFAVPGAGDYPDFYSESIDFTVDKSTNKIIHVSQSKAWRRYVYLSPGLLKEEEVHTTYDEKGEPRYSAWNTTLQRRTETFAEIEILLSNAPQKQQEIQQDFFSYLKNNGLENLIPVTAIVPVRQQK